MKRKYGFHWDAVSGEMGVARPQLGCMTRVEIYRLFQFTIRDVLETRYGTEEADNIFRAAGHMAGVHFFENYCKEASDISTLSRIVQDKFLELQIGIFRMEQVNLESMSFVMTVDEDLDCSGLPDTDEQICIYDEGFIAGLLEGYSGKVFSVREVDCWCSGSRTCRFAAKPAE